MSTHRFTFLDTNNNEIQINPDDIEIKYEYSVLKNAFSHCSLNFHTPFLDKKTILKKIHEEYAKRVILSDEKAIALDWSDVGTYIGDGINIVVSESPELKFFSEESKDQLNLGFVNPNG
jgi:hypothetical protein